ncbi:hypothetical protein M0802_014400 [Mischocyttarus mexicanus]|nr:hypothetical protein M0802_014400 [Mischocyttarus mexicanus]
MTEKLKEVYLDGDNVQFEGQYLEELKEQPLAVPQEKKEDIVERLFKRLMENTQEDRPQNMKQIAEGSCTDWYSAMLTKLTIDSEWSVWKNEFCEAFSSKGWDAVTYALEFKYKEGLLLDYALKKQKLLLEVSRTIDTRILVDLIAAGLPKFILNKMDRETLDNTVKLFKEIGKHEYAVKEKITYVRKGYGNISTTNKYNISTPCGICRQLDKGRRYHSEDTCWFKTTGNSSNVSLISSKLLKLKGKGNGANRVSLVTINGVKKAIGMTEIKIKIFELEKQVEVYVMDEKYFKHDFLIELDLIKKFKLVQNEDLKIIQKQEVKSMEEENEEERRKTNICKINFNKHEEEGKPKIKMEYLNNYQREEINKLINKYESIFAKDKYDIGRVSGYEARIDLLADKYCNKRPYKCTVKDRKEIEEQV